MAFELGGGSSRCLTEAEGEELCQYSAPGAPGALTNTFKYLEDNDELTQSLCNTHIRLILFSSLIRCVAQWIKEQEQMGRVFSERFATVPCCILICKTQSV